ETVEKLRALKNDGKISEDDIHRFQDQVQKITNAHIEQLDKLQNAKERDIMEV
ncbi:MAG: ribosome recycling factor, partial [Proteobacteria bacterium]|nr:ribosome recycling factor [Pseudomonadota bacterium]